jgi:hypothetical protein
MGEPVLLNGQVEIEEGENEEGDFGDVLGTLIHTVHCDRVIPF